MKHSFRFKGHESFIIREGWLNKGIQEVKNNPKVFFENLGADALGVGPNMAKSIRYWLKCSGLTEESRQKVSLTGLGEMILEKDPYFEDMFSLWIVHCNIVRNQKQATAWQLFFQKFNYEEFTREELEQEMLGFAKQIAEGEKVSERSVKDDCDAILRMYTRKQAKDSNPEEKNISPFGKMGLLKETEEGYAKEQPELHKLPEEIVRYLLAGMIQKENSMKELTVSGSQPEKRGSSKEGEKDSSMEGLSLLEERDSSIEERTISEEKGISIEELLTAPGSPGKVLNLKRTGLMELLERLERKDKLIVNQTAGLDMVYLPENIQPEQVIREYYYR